MYIDIYNEGDEMPVTSYEVQGANIWQPTARLLARLLAEHKGVSHKGELPTGRAFYTNDGACLVLS